MSELVKRNWWIPAPIALIGLGAYTTLTHIVGDGYESPWSHTASGWDPSLPERVGAVILLGFFFVALPIWALAVRRGHPGWTVAMLLPWVLMSLPPLMWSDAGGMLILPALGIVTLVGAIVNLVQRSAEVGSDMSRPETQRATG
jgi:hypothetical protein